MPVVLNSGLKDYGSLVNEATYFMHNIMGTILTEAVY